MGSLAKYSRWRLFIFLPVILILFSRCSGDYFKPGHYAPVTYSPTVAIPLAYADYSVNDLILKIDSAGQFTRGDSNIVILNYMDSAGPVNLAQYIRLSDQDYNFSIHPEFPSPVNFPAGDSVSSGNLTMDYRFLTDHNEILDSLVIKQTTLQISITDYIPANVHILIKLNSVSDPNGKPFYIPVNLNDQDGLPVQKEITLLLDGQKCDFTKNGITRNTFTVESDFTIYSTGKPIDPSQGINIRLQLLEPKFRSAYGYFGNQIVPLPEIDSKIGIFQYDISGFVDFQSPSVSVSIYNNAGISGLFTADELLFNTVLSGSFPIEGDLADNGVTVFGPSLDKFGEYVRTSILVDKSNSNLYEVFNKIPNELFIKSTLYTNPDNDSTTFNYLTDSSTMIPVSRITLPLSLQIVNLTGRQSFSIDNLDLNAENIRDINLKFKVENELPVGGRISLVFMDTITDFTLNLFNEYFNAIKPAVTDEMGFTAQPATDSVSIYLDRDQIDGLLKCNKLETEIILNTSESKPGKWSKITPDQHMKIQIGLVAGLITETTLSK